MTTKTIPTASPASSTLDSSADPPPDPLLSQRYRRRPAMIGLGVGLLAACAAGSAYLVQVANDSVPVVAVARDVPRGQIIESGDLTTAMALPDPALKPVPGDELATVIGQRAAADLTVGTLLTAGAVTSEDLPPAGQTIVGVAVQPNQLPARPLTPGDPIRVIDTPNSGDRPPQQPPRSIAAVVAGLSTIPDTGHVVIDALVPEDIAGPLAARVATGRIVVVLDSAQSR